MVAHLPMNPETRRILQHHDEDIEVLREQDMALATEVSNMHDMQEWMAEDLLKTKKAALCNMIAIVILAVVVLFVS